MISIPAISGAIIALKSSKDLIEAMVTTRDTAVFQEKRLELQSRIMDAQASVLDANEERAALVDQVRELEKEVADLKAWGADKERYELKSLDGGVLAYTLKDDAQPSEPMHHLCANCYQRGQKSILQPETRFPGRASVLVCFECGADIYVTGAREATHKIVPGRKR